MGLEYNSRRAKDPIHFQVYNYNYFLESYRVWKNLDSSLHSKCFSWSHLVNNESERERESQRQKSSHTTWTHWSRRSHKMFHIHFYSSTSTLGEIFSTSFVENCEVLCVYVLLIVCSYRVNLCLGLRVIKSIIVSVCLISNSYKNKRKRREIKKSWKL